MTSALRHITNSINNFTHSTFQSKMKSCIGKSFSVCSFRTTFSFIFPVFSFQSKSVLYIVTTTFGLNYEGDLDTLLP